MVKDITVYTSNNCAYCVQVKKFLTLKGQDYSEINIETDSAAQQRMIDMTGRSTVPVTVVTKVDGSQDVTVGFNVSKIASALTA